MSSSFNNQFEQSRVYPNRSRASSRVAQLVFTPNHVTSDLNNLNNQGEDYTWQDQLRMDNGQGLDIKHLGSSNLVYPYAIFILKNLLHIPHIQKNLLFVSQFI